MQSSLRILLAFGCLLALALASGCANLKGFNAKEVHVTTSYPLIFTDTIDAEGISKVTAADGSVTRKAESLTHATTVGGFTRTAVYKEAELETTGDPKK